MHELGVATELHRACRAEIEARGGGRLVSVSVEVGELAGVEPALLGYAWEAVVAGTCDADARLELHAIAARQTCAQCGAVEGRQPGSWLRLCPRCRGPLRVDGGRELDVVQLVHEVREPISIS